MLFQKQLDYQVLKIFVCLCFATNTQPHKARLAPRANPYVFLGFQCGFKGFKVYDLVQYKIIVTRDVVFHMSQNFLFLIIPLT